MSQFTKDTGKTGEQVAADYLQANGYEIVEKNFRVRRAEIDIIAKFNDVIAFIEVKTRRSNKFGTPAEAVDFHKQNKIILAANAFLQKNNLFDQSCRFDVIEVFASPNVKNWKINHIKNAFEVS